MTTGNIGDRHDLSPILSEPTNTRIFLEHSPAEATRVRFQGIYRPRHLFVCLRSTTRRPLQGEEAEVKSLAAVEGCHVLTRLAFLRGSRKTDYFETIISHVFILTRRIRTRWNYNDRDTQFVWNLASLYISPTTVFPLESVSITPR